ncbi:MAG: PEGA domain-containing protein, partial [Spirochaetota bacterium]
MKATAPALAAASVLIFLSGCAVTSGTTFESVVGAEQEAAREELTTTEEIVTDDELPPLRVVTSPEGASVSLDGRRRGVTPLDVEEIERGRHLLELDAEGYHRVRRWITVPQSGSLIVEIELTPITGFLEIDVVPSDATVRVDGERLRGTFAELRIGTYDVSIERFGFRREETDVTIRRDRVTEITFDLEPAAFEIEAIDVYRRRFSPANPGTTGSTLVSYRVTAPGEGTLRITDLSGEPVRTVAQGPYATWDQEFRWDGTDESGSRVPDGTYAIEVVAH